MNNTINQKDLKDIFRTFYATAAESIFFSSTHETLSTIDHMLNHIKFSKFKMEIIVSIFSNYNGMTLDIHSRRKTGKYTNLWKLNRLLLNNQWVKKQKRNEKIY